MKPTLLPALILLAGCPYLGDAAYDEKVRDLDGDGFVADRFGGPDCRDDNPDIGDCDQDGDGVRSVAAGGEDCDDSRADVFPGAPERCNDRDDDCDGLVDDDDALAEGPEVFADADGDGFGDPSTSRLWCDPDAPPRGFSRPDDATDCDDADPTIHPDALELCDAVDQNCDGDPTAGGVGAPNWYEDADGDGVGDGFAVTVSCDDPGGGLVPLDGDCAPGDPDVFPGQVEVPYDGIDQDCADGDAVDLDGDGFAGGPDGDDCDDTRSTTFPGASEVCNGRDDDCDGRADDGVLIEYWPDADGDLQGDRGADPVFACVAPANHVDDASDCDDTDASVRVGSVERCNGADDDCDDVIDEDAIDRVVRWRDADDDGFGDPTERALACEDALDPRYRWSTNDRDCDDSWEFAFPGGNETCDGYDNDCDGAVDEDLGGTFYVDNDGDGFGNPLQPVRACSAAAGELASNGDDCNDADPDTYPGAPEICGDSVRQDCSVFSPWDCDDDGFESTVVGGDDCDDSRAEANPDGREVCDGLDNDCDGAVDDDDADVDLSTVADWYLDADEDGFAANLAPLVAAQACAPVPGAAIVFGDCDDGDAAVNPDGTETCNGLDDDCDGQLDDVAPEDRTPWYTDADGDGRGAGDVVLRQCDAPGPGFAPTADDCLDTDPRRFPGQLEVCNGLDDDCDFQVDDEDPDALLDAWYTDADGDGFGYDGTAVYACSQPAGTVSDGGDCDDNRASKSPGALEVCDGGVDNDCDGLADDNDPGLGAETEWLRDRDGDGYGADDPLDDSDVVRSCSQPAGFVLATRVDCDDADPSENPGALEICDGRDNDCDGLADDADGNRVLAPAWYPDADLDGWGDRAAAPVYACNPNDGVTTFVVFGSDCDDSDPTRNPIAEEVCNGDVDDDCDGRGESTDPDAALPTWFADTDNDGFGDDSRATKACVAPAGSVAVGGDCDPNDADAYPGAPEVCGLDLDCDGDDQDLGAAGSAPFWLDGDGDGHGLANSAPTRFCAAPASGWAPDSADCDDTTALVGPGIPEVCDGAIDENCDGRVDEPGAIDGDAWYYDPDGDGFTDQGEIFACTEPVPSFLYTDAVLGPEPDCSPFDPAVFPGAPELCDGRRNDCSTTLAADEGAPGFKLWFTDADSDGFGADTDLSPLGACLPPPGRAPRAGDCDDSRAAVHPNQLVELCDGLDNDCDGAIDTADADSPLLGGVPMFVDADADGWGVSLDDGAGFTRCPADPLPTRFTTRAGDCDDGRGHVNPGGTEVCDADGRDENCNGLANNDDGGVLGRIRHYLDRDVDGFGDPAVPSDRCESPFDEWVTNSDDCDDDDAFRGAPREWGTDGDRDGWAGTATEPLSCDPPIASLFPVGDCDDSDPLRFPMSFLPVGTTSELDAALQLACPGAVIPLDAVDFDLTGYSWPPAATGVTLRGTDDGSNRTTLKGSLIVPVDATLLELDVETTVASSISGSPGATLTLERVDVVGGGLGTAILSGGANLVLIDVSCESVATCVKASGGAVTIDRIDLTDITGIAIDIGNLPFPNDAVVSGVNATGGPPAVPVIRLVDVDATLDDVEVFARAVLTMDDASIPSNRVTVTDLRAFGIPQYSPPVPAPAIRIDAGALTLLNAGLLGYDGAGIAFGDLPPNQPASLFLDQVTMVSNAAAIDATAWQGSDIPVDILRSVFADHPQDVLGAAQLTLFAADSVFETPTAGCAAADGCLIAPAGFMAYGLDGPPAAWRIVPFPAIGGNLFDRTAILDDDGTPGDLGFSGGFFGFTADVYETTDDALPDLWEQLLVCGFNPNCSSPQAPLSTLGDHDGDGLTDYDEYRLGTHPMFADSDDDGVDDDADCAPTDATVPNLVSCP